MRTASLFVATLFLIGCQVDDGVVVAPDTKSCSTTESYVAPVAGTANEDWYITNYVDVDPTPGTFSDFRGGFFTYDEHRGIDIALLDMAQMDQGIAVIAARCGVVTGFWDGEQDGNTSRSDSRWNFVEISHLDGSKAVYGHLKQNSVNLSLGQYVDVGEPIGLVGSSGNSTGPHLHFEVVNQYEQVVDIFAQGLGFAYRYADKAMMLDSGITVTTDPSIGEPDFFLYTPGKQEALLESENGVVWIKILGLHQGNTISIELSNDAGKRTIIGQLEAQENYKASFWYWGMQNLPIGNYTLNINGEQERYQTHTFSVIGR